MNFLALLGWAPDGETTIMPPDELVRRFSLDRVGASPATLDYQKLDWMNGVYLRGAAARRSTATRLVAFLGRPRLAGGPRPRVGAARPGEDRAPRRSSRSSPASSSTRPEPDGRRDAEILRAGDRDARRGSSRSPPRRSSRRCATLAERLGQKPRQAFQPIRVAVTGSTVSPGLFESIELLGREETLERLRSAMAASA